MSTYIDEVVGEVDSRPEVSANQDQPSTSDKAEKAFPLDHYREMMSVIKQRECRLKAD